jgi:hypothetical protein
MIEAEPPARNVAHNRHTGCREYQVLSGFERGAIDLACQWPRKVRQGLDQWLEAFVLKALFRYSRPMSELAIMHSSSIRRRPCEHQELFGMETAFTIPAVQ